MTTSGPRDPDARGEDAKRSFAAWVLPLALLAVLALMVLVWFLAKG